MRSLVSRVKYAIAGVLEFFLTGGVQRKQTNMITVGKFQEVSKYQRRD